MTTQKDICSGCNLEDFDLIPHPEEGNDSKVCEDCNDNWFDDLLELFENGGDWDEN